MLSSRVLQTVGGGARLTAYDMRDGTLKFTLFSEMLFGTDMPQIVIGMGCIVVLMWLYSGSLLFTLLGFAQIFLSIGLAFGVYMTVLYLPFFPFINATGTFLCVGIGADDIFVVLQAFDDAIRARSKEARGIDAPLVERVLRDAGSATLVTTVTTAGAFFAGAVSKITAIRCFGVFCGPPACQPAEPVARPGGSPDRSPGGSPEGSPGGSPGGSSGI